MKFETELELDKDFDINAPPKGAWIKVSANQILLGASTTDRMSAFAIFMLCGLIMRTFLIFKDYTAEYGIATPFWVGFFIIFFSPFFLIIVMALAGKVVVTITGDKCNVFRGIGRLGINKTVDLNTLSIKFVKSGGWELISKEKRILTTGIFGFLEKDNFMYLIKSIQKVLQDKDYFLPEDLSEHLI